MAGLQYKYARSKGITTDMTLISFTMYMYINTVDYKLWLTVLLQEQLSTYMKSIGTEKHIQKKNLEVLLEESTERLC